MKSSTRALLIMAVSVFAVLLPAFAAPVKVDLATETAGAEPKSLVPVVGVWRIENEGSKKVLAVDGRQWKEGQSSAGIADKARALYGERYAEFLDRVQAYAYFPYVVAKEVEDFKNGEEPERISGAAVAIHERIARGGKLILFGNGGSATDANDWALDCAVPLAGFPAIPALSLAMVVTASALVAARL